MGKEAIALISGGLDSIIAARLVREQGFHVTGLYFTSAFSKSYGNEHHTHAALASRSAGIDLRIIDLGQPYIDLIRTPRHGYGKNINPCIDCKIHMLQQARTVMEEVGSPFVITGEVLGQRPMSQRRDTLNVIERESGLRGRILRPLSAALLPPSQAEQDGVIDRSRFLGISGRGRTVQLQLAERYNLQGFSAPAGGCLLTDKNFAEKLRDLFGDKEVVTSRDIRLLILGRHFKFGKDTRIVLGRNSRENEILLDLADEGYDLFTPHQFPGPVAVLDGPDTPEIRQAVGRLILIYSKSVTGSHRMIRCNNEIFDPGDPLPIEALPVRKIGTEY
ncbi:MAG: thiamine biosynthesis protein [Nitrospiraceae bacterium]|nr:thiamine biosynthesis protein [Nitrospiraceae bacterium]